MKQKQERQKAEEYYELLYRGTKMGKALIRIFEGSMVILILLAVSIAVTPRISQAHQESQLSVLVRRLHQIRAQIAVYQGEHGGLYPGQLAAGQSVDALAFIRALTKTDSFAGKPYLSEIPDNPFAQPAAGANSITCVHDPAAVPTGAEQTAWWFNTATGRFAACDSAFHAAY